jgi:acyl carrier protein
MTAARPASSDDVTAFLRGELLHDPDLEVGIDEPLFSSGLLDSFAVTQLIVYLEDRFEIRIPIAAVTLADFDSVEKILEVVARYASPSKP